MIIREERKENYDIVYHVIKEAFATAEYTDVPVNMKCKKMIKENVNF